MGLKKGDVITKNDIFEYLISKDYESIGSLSVASPGVGQHTAREVTDLFWIRNQPAIFVTDPWLIGTTYPTKYRCSYANIVYEAKSLNTGYHPDINPTYWKVVPNATIKTSPYYNCKLTFDVDGSISSADDYVRIWIYSVTWDGNSEEVLTQIFYKEEDDSVDSEDYLTLEPGPYRYKIRCSSQGSSSNSRGVVYAKRYANDIEYGKNIKVFTPDYSELDVLWCNPITVALAQSGRLTTVDYLGGDFGDQVGD